ncbi:MAG: response regulator [Gemmatimonadota bacterium]|nr:response regulator [Gemmatimonadota bacterium]
MAISVLVIDDNHDNVDIVREGLEARGYAVSVAYSGEEGLALFESERPTIVLLDVMMPGRNGWDVCRVMKQHPEHGKNMRVIMLTALGGWDDKQTALQTGADDFMTKPIDLSELAERVQRNAALVTPASSS